MLFSFPTEAIACLFFPFKGRVQYRDEMTRRRSCIYLLAILAASLLFQTSRSASVRTKRSIGQFGNMIRLTTRMEALLFNDYGNHCGSGDTANAPVIDSIDRCCREHDRCYENLTTGPCSSSYFGPYFTFYSWSIATNGSIRCDGTNNDCKLATCICDRTAAECLARYAADYDPANKKSSIWDWLI